MTGMPISRVFDLDSFRFRNDDGDKDTATFAAALNTNIAWPADFPLRIRFLVQEVAGSNQLETPRFRLQYATNGGSFVDAITPPDIRGLSAFIVNVASDIVQRIGTGTLRDGRIEENSQGGAAPLAATLGLDEYEIEFVVNFPTAGFSPGTTVDLRLLQSNDNNGTSYSPFATYTRIPRVTIAQSLTPSLAAYRIYNNDGTEATSTPVAAQNTTAIVSVASGAVTKHIHARIDATAGTGNGQSTDQWKLQARRNAGAWSDLSLTGDVRLPFGPAGSISALVNTPVAALDSPYASPNGIDFSPDGLHMIVMDGNVSGSGADATIYTLTKPFDISTAGSPNSLNNFLGADLIVANGVLLSPDGLFFSIVYKVSTVTTVTQLRTVRMTTPWVISSGTTISDTVLEGTGTANDFRHGLSMSPDGAYLIVAYDPPTGDSAIWRYALIEPFKPWVGVLRDSELFVGSKSPSFAFDIDAFAWNNDGTKVLLYTASSDLMREHAVSTPFLPSAISTVTADFKVMTVPADVLFNMHYGESDAALIIGLSHPTTDVQTFAVATPEATLIDSAATTNRATNGITDGAGTFIAGAQDEIDGVITGFTLTSGNFTEIVWAARFDPEALFDGDVVEFRVLRNNVAITSAVTPTVNITSSPAVLDQDSFRFRFDDEAGSWAAPLNSSINLAVNRRMRLRFLVQNSGGLTKPIFQLRVSENSGAYVTIDTAASLAVGTSAFLSDGTTQDAVQRIGGGTLSDGVIVSNSVASTATFVSTGEETEIEFVINLDSGVWAAGSTADFRLYADGAPLSTYTVTPRITVVVADEPDVTAFRLYNNDGDELSATPLAGENTRGFVDATTDDVTVHLRMLLEADDPVSTDSQFKLEYRKNAGAWTALSQTSNNVRSAGGFQGSTGPSAQLSNSSGFYMHPSGTHIYVIDRDGGEIQQWNLGTPYDVTTVTTFAGLGTPFPTGQYYGLDFSPDGVFVYTSREISDVSTSNDAFYRATLSTPWSISTAASAQNVLVNGVQHIRGCAIKPDGTKIYTSDPHILRLSEFSIATPYDLTTANIVSQFLIQPVTKTIGGVVFQVFGGPWFTDGNFVYCIARAQQQDLSTAEYVVQIALSAPYVFPSVSDQPPASAFSWTKLAGNKRTYGGGFNVTTGKFYTISLDGSIGTFDASVTAPLTGDGEFTTNRVTDGLTDPGLGSFVSSQVDSNDSIITGFGMPSGDFTELLYVVTLLGADLVLNDVLEFRIVNNAGTPLTATVTPSIQIGFDPDLLLSGYRFYNNDGTDLTATPIAAQNTPVAIDAVLIDKVFHLRTQIDELGNSPGLPDDRYHLEFRLNAGAWSLIEPGAAVAPAQGALTNQMGLFNNAALIRKDTNPIWTNVLDTLRFSADGLHALAHANTIRTFYIHTLTTAFDLRTISITTSFDYSTDFPASTYNTRPGIDWNPDGDRILIVFNDMSNNGQVVIYSLGTPFDASTAIASPPIQNVGVNTWSSPVFRKGTGTQAFFVDVGNTRIETLNLGTAWNLSGTNTLGAVSGNLGFAPNRIDIRADGLRILTSNPGGNLNQYPLGTAWAANTLSSATGGITTGTTGSDYGAAYGQNDQYIEVVSDSHEVWRFSMGPREESLTAIRGDSTNRAADGITDPTGNFAVGKYQNAGAVYRYTHGLDEFSEHVHALKLNSALLNEGDVIEFRLMYNDVVVPATATPTINVGTSTPSLIVDTATYAVSMQDTGLNVAHRLQIDTGDFQLTPQQTAFSFVTVVDSASYTNTFQDTALIAQSNLAVDTAVFTITPADTLLELQRVIVVDPVNYAVSLQNTDLIRSYSLTVDTVSYTISPQETFFAVDYVQTVDPAAYTVVWQDVNTNIFRSLVVDPVSYVTTFQDVALTANSRLLIDAAAYNTAFNDMSLLQQHILTVEQASYSITTFDAFFTITIPFDNALFSTASQDTTLIAGYLQAVDPVVYATTFQDTGLVTSEALTVDTAAFSTNFLNVDLNAAYRLAVDSATYTITYNNIDLAAAGALNVDTASYTTSFQDVSLTALYVLSVDSATFSITTQNTNLLASYVLEASNYTYAVSPAEVAVPVTYVLAIDTTSYVISWQDTAFVIDYIQTVDSAAYSITFQNVVLATDNTLAVDTVSYNITFQDTILAVSNVLPVDLAAYEVTTQDTTLETNYLLLVDTALYTITFQDVAQTTDNTLVVDSVVYAISWQDVTFLTNYVLFVDSATYSTTFNDVVLATTKLLVVDTDTYTIVWQDTAFVTDYVQVIDPVTYSTTFQNVALATDNTLIVDTNSYAVAFQDANLAVTYRLAVDTATYSISTVDTTLAVNYIFTVDPGTYTTSFFDVAFSTDNTLGVNQYSYAATFQDVATAANYRLQVDAATFTVDTQDTNLLRNFSLIIDTVVYAVDAADTVLAADYKLTIDTASVLIQMQDVGLFTTLQLGVDTAAYFVATQDTNFALTNVLAVDQAAFTATFNDIVQQFSGTIIVDPQSYTLSYEDVGVIRAVLLQVDSYTIVVDFNDISFSQPLRVLQSDPYTYISTFEDILLNFQPLVVLPNKRFNRPVRGEGFNGSVSESFNNPVNGVDKE